MKKIMFVALAALLIAPLALTLAACNNAPPQPPKPVYAYQKYPPTLLNVASIQVVQAYTMPSRIPNVEHLMLQPLPNAVSEWARTRFKAVGTEGSLLITIRDASIVGKDLNRTQGVKGWFTIDQAERFDANVLVEFQVDGMANVSTGSGTVRVSRGQSVPEDQSLQERDRALTSMEEQVMMDVDASGQQMLENRLSTLIRR